MILANAAGRGRVPVSLQVANTTHTACIIHPYPNSNFADLADLADRLSWRTLGRQTLGRQILDRQTLDW
jgi:hypothetical protein